MLVTEVTVVVANLLMVSEVSSYIKHLLMIICYIFLLVSLQLLHRNHQS